MTSMRKTLRVLNVEDSEQDMALLARHLKRADYDLVLDRVDTAETMKAALESRECSIHHHFRYGRRSRGGRGHARRGPRLFDER